MPPFTVAVMLANYLLDLFLIGLLRQVIIQVDQKDTPEPIAVILIGVFTYNDVLLIPEIGLH